VPDQTGRNLDFGILRRQLAGTDRVFRLTSTDQFIAAARGFDLAWTVLFIAGLLEIVWVILFKQSEGYTRWGYALAGLGVSVISFAMVGWTLKTLPVGTAYAVWTGMGAAGAAIVGILLFNEPATAVRLACVALILIGIIGLKLTH
jgi:quaternary ammonium compound-resistance protein SugE